jgi:hypothetical protein
MAEVPCFSTLGFIAPGWDTNATFYTPDDLPGSVTAPASGTSFVWALGAVMETAIVASAVEGGIGGTSTSPGGEGGAGATASGTAASSANSGAGASNTAAGFEFTSISHECSRDVLDCSMDEPALKTKLGSRKRKSTKILPELLLDTNSLFILPQNPTFELKIDLI